MVQNKIYDFNNRFVDKKLTDFVSSKFGVFVLFENTEEKVHILNAETLENFTFMFEAIMYWSVYWFSDKITNIIDFQNYVDFLVSEEINPLYIQDMILDYVGVKNEV